MVTEYDGDFNAYISDFVAKIGFIFDALLPFVVGGGNSGSSRLEPQRVHQLRPEERRRAKSGGAETLLRLSVHSPADSRQWLSSSSARLSSCTVGNAHQSRGFDQGPILDIPIDQFPGGQEGARLEFWVTLRETAEPILDVEVIRPHPDHFIPSPLVDRLRGQAGDRLHHHLVRDRGSQKALLIPRPHQPLGHTLNRPSACFIRMICPVFWKSPVGLRSQCLDVIQHYP